MEDDQHSHGLDPLAWEERLWTRAGLAGRSDSFRGTQHHPWHQGKGMKESRAVHSSVCVAGGQEVAAVLSLGTGRRLLALRTMQ